MVIRRYVARLFGVDQYGLEAVHAKLAANADHVRRANIASAFCGHSAASGGDDRRVGHEQHARWLGSRAERSVGPG
jgi:hypothetical protein